MDNMLCSCDLNQVSKIKQIPMKEYLNFGQTTCLPKNNCTQVPKQLHGLHSHYSNSRATSIEQQSSCMYGRMSSYINRNTEQLYIWGNTQLHQYNNRAAVWGNTWLVPQSKLVIVLSVRYTVFWKPFGMLHNHHTLCPQ